MKHVNSAFCHHQSRQRRHFDWHLSTNQWELTHIYASPSVLLSCGMNEWEAVAV